MITAIDWLALEELVKLLSPGVLIGAGLSATCTALAYAASCGFRILHKCLS